MKRITILLLLVAVLTSSAMPIYVRDIVEASYCDVFEDVRNGIRSGDLEITAASGYLSTDISEVSFTFYDIDGNGVKELILTTQGGTGIVYTLVDGEGIELAFWPGYRHCFEGINELGYIYGAGSSSATSGVIDYYRITEDGKGSELMSAEYEYYDDDYVIYEVTTPQWTKTMTESEFADFISAYDANDVKLDNWKTLTDDSGRVYPPTEFPDAIGGFSDSPKSLYSADTFSDIDENQWYGVNDQAVVQKAYELRIMDGKGGGVFDPRGYITFAESVKMAAVVHNIYNGGDGYFTQGKIWYQVYFDYAISAGIIESAATTGNNNRNATRAEMASIFAHSVPDSELQEINTVNNLPDVQENSIYGEDIFKLFRAGVLTGDDSKGTFRPSDSIIRAEAAAIICRVVIPSERQTLNLSGD